VLSGRFSSGADADSFKLIVKAVPEPSTWAKLGLGFAGLAFTGRGAARKHPFDVRWGCNIVLVLSETIALTGVSAWRR